MPKLNAIVENLDDVPEALRDYYVEQKDKDNKAWFVLQLDEDVKNHPEVTALQRAHERQKEENKKLKTDNAELKAKVEHLPEDFKADEWERLREVEKQLNALKDSGEADPEKKKAHEAEIQSFKKTHEQQVAKITKQMEEGFKEREAKIAGLNGRLHKMVVRDGLVRLLAENGVKKEVLDFVQAKLERSIKVVENDDGDPSMVFDTDLGEVPADQFIPKWAQSDEAKPFVEAQSGGGALGGQRKQGFGDTNPWSAAHWDMRKQGEIWKKDAGRAERMAKAAGHKKALGALQMDAK